MALASWRAPTTAARLAEQLRRSAQVHEERRRQKLHVFTTLMQERAAIWTEEAVRGLNVIDIVFYDCRPVREAWAALLHMLTQQPLPPLHAQQDRVRDLLAAMAADLGLADDIRTDDLNRVYIPTPMAQDCFIRQLERQERLARLQQAQGQPAANTSPAGSIWPPPP